MKRLRTWTAHDHKPSPAYPPGVSPLPIPDGWFYMGLAGEVKPGQVVTRRLGRQDVVLWRTDGPIGRYRKWRRQFYPQDAA
ncbi:hypothetical protein AB0G20_27625 [Streptomyces sp. NPDC024017]|uniref:hypothetical protein n=1 Tax=Streptomyces sp. NPDC024017 TaxID=3154326 RepID=UPI003408C6F0